MAEAEADRSSVPLAPSPLRGRPAWARGMACVAIIPLIGFIGLSGRSLWVEWASLREDRLKMRESGIVGYLDIAPRPSYAGKPPDWFHDEGDDALLWAGWKDGEHRWFRIGRGEIQARSLSLPIGKDSIQAIDHPVYEADGGLRWARVPQGARVAAFEDAGLAYAYPIRVLDKVEVVNDQVNGRPVLVAFTPMYDTVSIFDATLDGKRVTLGHGGYFLGNRPILYDRGTTSLWSESEGGMTALAGRLKGATLKRIARPEVVSWGDWRTGHPGGKLLVGADRSKAMPVD